MRSYWGDEIFLWIALLAIEIGGVGWYWNPSEIDTSVQWTQGVSLHGHIRTLERTLPISDGNSDLIWLSSEVRSITCRRYVGKTQRTASSLNHKSNCNERRITMEKPPEGCSFSKTPDMPKPEDVEGFAFAPVCELGHVYGFGCTELTIKQLTEDVVCCQECGRQARYTTIKRWSEAQWLQDYYYTLIAGTPATQAIYEWRQYTDAFKPIWTKAEKYEPQQ